MESSRGGGSGVVPGRTDHDGAHNPASASTEEEDEKTHRGVSFGRESIAVAPPDSYHDFQARTVMAADAEGGNLTETCLAKSNSLGLSTTNEMIPAFWKKLRLLDSSDLARSKGYRRALSCGGPVADETQTRTKSKNSDTLALSPVSAGAAFSRMNSVNSGLQWPVDVRAEAGPYPTPLRKGNPMRPRVLSFWPPFPHASAPQVLRQVRMNSAPSYFARCSWTKVHPAREFF